MDKHQHHNGRHEHHGLSSKGMFDDRSILEKIGLEKGKIFLDGGCADGHFSIAASRIVGNSGKVFAVDIHTPSLELLRKEVLGSNIQNITLMENDLRNTIPLDKSSLDHFFMSNVMHGFVFNGEAKEVIQNVSSPLKRGGVLSLIEWDKENVISGPPRDHRLSYEEAVSLIVPYGFSPLKREMVGSEHVLMLFQKL